MFNFIFSFIRYFVFFLVSFSVRMFFKFQYTQSHTHTWKTDEQFNKFDNTTKPISDDEFKDIFSSLDGFIPEKPRQPMPEVPRMMPVQAAPPSIMHPISQPSPQIIDHHQHHHQQYPNYVPGSRSGRLLSNLCIRFNHIQID